jgi:NAD(P)-dependent dehydrogenase (short-subunit alcohol dehydrogenase family)
MTTTGLQRTIAVAGAASGIGAATARRLRAEGHRVITIDRHQADVTGDLATTHGRWRVIARVTLLARGRLDGLVQAPTLEDRREASGAHVVSASYFGRVAILEGLWPALAAGGQGAVVLATGATEITEGPRPLDLVRLCLEGAEADARGLADQVGWERAAAASALALARYVRRQAHSRRWRAAGVRLIAIAPGVGDLPRLGPDLNAPEVIRELQRFRSATDGVAARITFLMGDEAQNWWQATLGGEDPDSEMHDDEGIHPASAGAHWMPNRRPVTRELVRLATKDAEGFSRTISTMYSSLALTDFTDGRIDVLKAAFGS